MPNPDSKNPRVYSGRIKPEIRTIIADDEPLARKKLRILLASERDVQIVAECRDARRTIAALTELKPDLLLLDIQMPDADGFQVLRSIPPEQMPIVIFTTAYDQYAIRAFEAHASDYLLKPFDQDRLHRAIERVRTELLKTANRDLARHILDWLAHPETTPPADRRLVVKAGGRVVFLDLDEIDWVDAAANYVQLHAGRELYLVRERISRMSERLDPGQFVRIHRSAIVNVRKIKELQPCNSGEYMVVLKNGKELSCSRSYRSGLQQFFGDHL
jgi:two-component system, LytTR family, response regulator